MIQITENRYIVRNDKILSGEPIVKGTRTPVRAIVETWRQGGFPEEIPHLLPHCDCVWPVICLGENRCPTCV